MRAVIAKPEIVTTLQSAGIEFLQRGGRLWACCPLHQERTPSFCVDTNKQRFKCFGCHASGDVIDFIIKLKGLSFRDAIRYLGINSEDSVPAMPSPEELRRREAVRHFREWCTNYAKWIGEMLRRCNEIDALVLSPVQLEIEGLTEMYLARDIYEYHLTTLQSNEDNLKFAIFERVINGRN